MGVTRRVDAGERQLDDGLHFLRSELRKFAQAYPEEAERLRIPGSVAAIDNRLAAATFGSSPARDSLAARPFGERLGRPGGETAVDPTTERDLHVK
jgi:hypothetical protein